MIHQWKFCLLKLDVKILVYYYVNKYIHDLKSGWKICSNILCGTKCVATVFLWIMCSLYSPNWHHGRLRHFEAFAAVLRDLRNYIVWYHGVQDYQGDRRRERFEPQWSWEGACCISSLPTGGWQNSPDDQATIPDHEKLEGHQPGHGAHRCSHVCQVGTFISYLRHEV